MGLMWKRWEAVFSCLLQQSVRFRSFVCKGKACLRHVVMMGTSILQVVSLRIS